MIQKPVDAQVQGEFGRVVASVVTTPWMMQEPCHSHGLGLGHGLGHGAPG